MPANQVHGVAKTTGNQGVSVVAATTAHTTDKACYLFEKINTLAPRLELACGPKSVVPRNSGESPAG